MEIRKAEPKHLDDLARLFDLYRQFYDCPADFAAAKKFISARINNADSIIFVGEHNNELVGFTQMYPSFCSVDAIKIYILYDLYVVSSQRSLGVGAKLMNRAKEHAIEHGAQRIDLVTAVDNKSGRALYEALGYRTALEGFVNYSLAL